MPVAPRLYTAQLPNGCVAVMDTRTGRGRWHHLNATAARLWLPLAEGADLNDTADQVTAIFTSQGADHDTVRADLAALTRQLREAGLLSAPAQPAPDAHIRHIRPTVAAAPLRLADRAAGIVGAATALVLLRCAPIRASITVARWLGRLPVQVAEEEHADLLFLAVRRAARWWPGRSACLEESLGCYLAALLRGHRVAWVIGARTAPAEAHAWTETENAVIGQEPVDRVWPYAPALRI
ncbi:lasso peptide biosynthesis B2 protein [Streptomyces sp. NPDC059070]|uniref:lasso peptide biosynthesis B2 protein n=1 Tax=Streptomyces sp. NPDC059070 TaxID=3346713 RepID=UPI00369CDF26